MKSPIPISVTSFNIPKLEFLNPDHVICKYFEDENFFLILHDAFFLHDVLF